MGKVFIEVTDQVSSIFFFYQKLQYNLLSLLFIINLIQNKRKKTMKKKKRTSIY